MKIVIVITIFSRWFRQFHISLVLALVLAAMMIVSMIPAMATGTNTITVDVNFKGQTYKLYKIFNATTNAARQAATDTNNSSSVTTDGIAYTLIDETDHALTKEFTVTKADGAEATVKGADWFEFVNGANKNIKAKSGADITTELFRLWAAAYGVATGNELTATADNDSAIKWQNLEDGYYFITTTTGSLVTVDSVAPNATVKDKNEVPCIEKTVQEDSLIGSGTAGDGVSGYQKQNDAEVGQKVYYKTVIHAKSGAKGYVLYDKMDDGLTFDGVDSVAVKVNSSNVAKTSGSNKTWDIATTGKYASTNNDATFTITFDDAYIATITASGSVDITVTYTATVNSNAVINVPELNDTILKYGNNTTPTYTPEDHTKTLVWGIDVLKIEGTEGATTADVNSKKLAGAQFVIYKKVGNDIFYALFDSNKKLTGWTTTAETVAEANLPKQEPSHFDSNAIVETGNDGTVAVTGIDEGTYYLLEVKAPDGYNKLNTALTVTVDSTSDTAGNVLDPVITSDTNGSTNITVGNGAGATLPSTGGIGTTIFYVAGSLMVLAAAILLITKRRMGAND